MGLHSDEIILHSSKVSNMINGSKSKFSSKINFYRIWFFWNVQRTENKIESFGNFFKQNETIYPTLLTEMALFSLLFSGYDEINLFRNMRQFFAGPENGRNWRRTSTKNMSENSQK